MKSYASFNQAYPDLYQEVRQSGIDAAPRGKRCVELRPGYFELRDPHHSLYGGHERHLNFRFYVAETLSYLAGWGLSPEHADLLVAVNPNVKHWVNPTTGVFDGAYGPRLRHSLWSVHELLRQDPWSRQAVASVWDSDMHLQFSRSLDLPCTLSLHFYSTGVSDGRHALGLTATMRSNDLNWGTPYDVAAFCTIQVMMAKWLDWDVGTYVHVAGSLHYYEESPPKVNLHGKIVPFTVPQCHRPYRMDSWLQAAETFLNEMLYHASLRAGWSDFSSALERAPDGSYCDYWRQWGDLVRFSWSKP